MKTSLQIVLIPMLKLVIFTVKLSRFLYFPKIFPLKGLFEISRFDLFQTDQCQWARDACGVQLANFNKEKTQPQGVLSTQICVAWKVVSLGNLDKQTQPQGVLSTQICFAWKFVSLGKLCRLEIWSWNFVGLSIFVQNLGKLQNILN